MGFEVEKIKNRSEAKFPEQPPKDFFFSDCTPITSSCEHGLEFRNYESYLGKDEAWVEGFN